MLDSAGSAVVSASIPNWEHKWLYTSGVSAPRWTPKRGEKLPSGEFTGVLAKTSKTESLGMTDESSTSLPCETRGFVLGVLDAGRP
eukprot:6177113-Pleurochrysis_carterae.AAC.2